MIKWIAHRGNGVTKYPENSCEALMQALSHPMIDGVELDVRLTKDHEVIIFHDATLERMSDGIGFVKDKTWKELKQLTLISGKYHTKISKLSSFLKRVHTSKIILIELKEETGDYKILADKVCRILDRYSNLNLYLVSFRVNLMKYIEKKYPKYRAGVFVNHFINYKYVHSSFSFQAVTPVLVDNVNMRKETFVYAIYHLSTVKSVQKKIGNHQVGMITDQALKFAKELK